MSVISSVVPTSNFNFTLLSPSPTRFGPRLGNAVLRRPASSTEQLSVQVHTPGLLASTSRGVVPHLSLDRYKSTDTLRWVHVPFETFLEHTPPVPTLQQGHNPLHTFLGFSPAHHILSVSARDPHDGREMPPNGNNHISAYSLRGVRKVTPAEWRSYALASKPDIIVALSDTPFTNLPYSQKRLTKSIERSAAWLASLIKPNAELGTASGNMTGETEPPYTLNVLGQMAGGVSIPARRAFADSLLEPLYGPEAEAVKPYACLDEGIAGYTFDLVPLRIALEASKTKQVTAESIPSASDADTPSTGLENLTLDPTIPLHTDELVPLLQTSLARLPIAKPRVANSTQTPHEILRLISSIGIDLFDAHWAQRAADTGVALDFQFPIVLPSPSLSEHRHQKRTNGKYDLGHNLYHTRYTKDFSPLADSFRGAFVDAGEVTESGVVGKSICSCAACSPIRPLTRIFHGVDGVNDSGEPVPESTDVQYSPPFTRAYIHHLLHTHEMSAHSFLVMHNLAVLDSFFAGIRLVLKQRPEEWAKETERFLEAYDEGLEVLDEARVSWKDVEMARGKGRLAREKAKQEEGTLGTAVEDGGEI